MNVYDEIAYFFRSLLRMDPPSSSKPICGLCSCTNRPLICQNCTNKELTQFQESLSWKSLLEQRNQLEGKLQGLLEARRKLHQQQQLWLYFSTARKELETKRAGITRRTRSMRRKAERMESSNHSRLSHLKDSIQMFKNSVLQSLKRQSCDDQSISTFLDICEKHYNDIRKHELQLLVDTIELRKTNSGVQIMNTSYPSATLTEIPEELGAALGYVLWLTDKLGFYCDVPLLYLGRYECSTSYVMKPERIFNRQRNAHWTKHRLYLPSNELESESRIEVWNEVSEGVGLIERSLRSIAASIDLDNTYLPCFDLLFLIIEKLMMENAQEEDSGPCSCMVNQSEDGCLLEHGMEDDWCEIAFPVLPPPPWADADIAQYESAFIKHQEATSMWRDLCQSPLAYLQSWFLNQRLHNKNCAQHK